MKRMLMFVIMGTMLLMASIGLCEDVPAAVPGIDAHGLWLAVIAALLALSEALSFIPSVKANGVFQLIFGILGKLAGK